MMRKSTLIPATNVALYKYFGMWQATDKSDASAMVSYWTLAYVELDFTGDCISLAFSRESSFKYRIDNGQYISGTSSGTYTISGAGNGKHTVRLLSQGRKNHIYFAGAYESDTCRLSRTANKPHYVQFIGDSISEA